MLASSVAATLVRRASSRGGSPVVTEREVEVLELLSSGKGTRRWPLSHIYAKLGVDTRAGAVAAAIEKRIIRR